MMQKPRSLADRGGFAGALCVCLLLLGGLLGGCMTSSYTIPQGELERLAQTPPGERGEDVRVVQRWSTSRDPIPATGGQIESMRYHDNPNARRVGASAGVRINAVIIGHGHHHATHYHRRRSHWGGPSGPNLGGGVRAGSGGGRGVVHAARPGIESQPVKVVESGGRPGGGGGGSGGGGSMSIGDGKGIVYAVILAAVAVTAYLVVTEGLREDGWAEMSPDQPVHLMYEDGRESVVGLWQLQPGHLVGLGEAVILAEEGDMAFAERAPLDRVGFGWRMEGGVVQVGLPRGDAPLAPAGLIQIGYFPVQWLGALFTSSFAIAADDSFVDIQYGAEIDLIPLALGPLHIGAYFSGGMDFTILSRASGDDVNHHEPMLQVGGLLEMDLTTRMALSSHLGVLWQRRDDAFVDPTFVGTVGVSVY